MTAPDSGSAGLPTSTGALYRAALGPAGARLHLPEIARFEVRGRAGMRWSAPAALRHLACVVYWRLWDVALALVALTVIGAGALGWMWHRADGLPLGVRIGLTLTLVLLWWALPAFWGLSWLHRGLRERVALAVSEADTLEGALESLRRSESAWWLRGVAVAAAALVVTAGLAGAVWHWSKRPPAAARSVAERPAASTPPATPPSPVSETTSASSSPALPTAPVAETETPSAASPMTPSVPATPPAMSVDGAKPAPTASESVAPADPGVPVTNEVRPRVRGHGVNVGMFAVPANAEQVQARLTKAGLPVLADPIESARGPLTRVRVGPFESREQAEAAARKVKAMGLEARVYAP